MNKITLSNELQFEVSTTSTITLLQHLSKYKIVEPQVPKYEEVEGSGEFIENPFHPLYHEAMAVYEATKAEKIFNTLLKLSIATFDNNYLKDSKWKNLYTYLKRQRVYEIPQEEYQCYLQYYAFNNIQDKNLLANTVLLTERRVYDIFSLIGVTRNSYDINTIRLKNSIDTKIQVTPIFIGQEQLVNPLDEYTACIESNMQWEQWLRHKYTLDEKASAIALHRLNKIVTIHNEDAVQIESERKRK